jgi:putative endonuclease
VTDRRRTLGQAAEAAAAAALTRAGLRVLARNVRFARGEGPAAAVSWRKRRRLVQLAQLYLKKHGLTEVPCRFDVVAVTDAGDGRLTVRHLPGAFDSG